MGSEVLLSVNWCSSFPPAADMPLEDWEIELGDDDDEDESYVDDDAEQEDYDLEMDLEDRLEREADDGNDSPEALGDILRSMLPFSLCTCIGNSV